MSAQPAGTRRRRPFRDPRTGPCAGARRARSSTSTPSGTTSRRSRRTRGPAEVMAVVKADGYGHGLLPSARAARARRRRPGSGVAQLGEALALRAAGIDRRRCCPGCTCPGSDFAAARRRRRRPVGLGALGARRDRPPRRARSAGPPGSTSRSTPAWAATAPSATTGPTWSAAAPAAEAEGAVRVVGVWSHFAYADAPGHPTVRLQQERLRRGGRAGRAGRLPARGAAPGQLGRHPDQPRRPLRPRPARARGLRAVAGAATSATPRRSGCARR